MRNAISTTDASFNQTGQWVWCIPGRQVHPRAPISILRTGPSGPHNLPTYVQAPKSLRQHSATYKQLFPTRCDIELVSKVSQQEMARSTDQSLAALIRSVTTGQSVAAAARFLPLETGLFALAPCPAPRNGLLIGRPVSLFCGRLRQSVFGWLVSDKSALEVVIIMGNTLRRFRASTDEIVLDDTAHRRSDA